MDERFLFFKVSFSWYVVNQNPLNYGHIIKAYIYSSFTTGTFILPLSDLYASLNYQSNYYSKTPLIRISGDQFNRFGLRGFRIRED